ncbi:hypothetical protein FVB9288_03037 [Flavobacterium sp. CECT 9288]|nr:hypothetical protein FVB9288_03037 [Flavobacterium sp. CECT 9288]
MSERWKFKLKYGLIWGFMASSITAAFDVFEMSIEDAFLSRRNLFRILFFVFTGIFIISYFAWEKKIREKRSNNLSNNNTVNK